MAESLMDKQLIKSRFVGEIEDALKQAHAIIASSESDIDLDENLKGSNKFFTERFKPILDLIKQQISLDKKGLNLDKLEKEKELVEAVIRCQDDQDTVNLADDAVRLIKKNNKQIK